MKLELALNTMAYIQCVEFTHKVIVNENERAAAGARSDKEKQDFADLMNFLSGTQTELRNRIELEVAANIRRRQKIELSQEEIITAFKEAKGNATNAAEALSLHRSAFNRRAKKYGVDLTTLRRKIKKELQNDRGAI